MKLNETDTRSSYGCVHAACLPLFVFFQFSFSFSVLLPFLLPYSIRHRFLFFFEAKRTRPRARDRSPNHVERDRERPRSRTYTGTALFWQKFNSETRSGNKRILLASFVTDRSIDLNAQHVSASLGKLS